MSGPCLCGDPACWSCGPAQGIYPCPHCGSTDECECEHEAIRQPAHGEYTVEDLFDALSGSDIEEKVFLRMLHPHETNPNRVAEVFRFRVSQDAEGTFIEFISPI